MQYIYSIGIDYSSKAYQGILAGGGGSEPLFIESGVPRRVTGVGGSVIFFSVEFFSAPPSWLFRAAAVVPNPDPPPPSLHPTVFYAITQQKKGWRSKTRSIAITKRNVGW